MSARALLSDLATGLLDLVFAPECLACGGAIPTTSAERRVCAACWSRLRPLPLPRCPRCWTPRPSQPAGPTVTTCADCSGLPPSLRAVRSACVHEGTARDLVHALKFGGWPSLAAPLAQRMAALPWPREVEEEARLVVPVPLGAARLRERGYNQAALLAEEVARRTGRRTIPDLLVRSRATERQATLHRAERRDNVSGAFQVQPARAAEIRREHLLLVDDVWTTGATARACGEALLAAGARAYSVLTFARALPGLDR